MALIMTGSPRPSDHRDAASASFLASSTLLAASTTGLPDRRSTFATASSSSVAPTRASTTNSTASAMSTAILACSATWAARPFARASQPPVSTTVKARPRQLASYATRSLVTPGTSCTTAWRLPRMRFTMVDLPTFGRPTTASTGCDPSTCQSVPSAAGSPAGERRMLASQPRDRVDHLGQRQAGGVDEHGVLGLGGLGGVQPVTPCLIGLGDVDRTALLGGAACGARPAVRGQEHLDRCARRHDRADVTAIGDDAASGCDDRTLPGDEVAPHRRHPCHHAHLGGDLSCPDLLGHVPA